ncbi:PREDICTED: uncharacterized protein LOC101812002 isoform X2 [Ficedula albicollis]|uniref:uncharacterized protein LOC101812002 isoform X2 n=1 Tax=Ficedula albicollis TaxID=59894 RepID=UPI00035939ED|nr:PREDICTED: uncharacterized protein LOC101812002 isoform X2 [Ficedula albicollis]
MGAEKKEDKIYIYTRTNNNPPAMEAGWEQLLPRVADWGWFGWQGVFLALFCCCPSTWVVPIVKGSRGGLGKGAEGGQLGLVALLGRCQKTKTKHVFILSAPAWAQASAGEREGEGGARQQKAAVLRSGPAATSLRSRPSSRSCSSSPSPCPPGFACQVRVGTAPPAAPNKAVTHPRAGADSKQSDRRIFRMLIQTARRRASGGAPPCHAHTACPPAPSRPPHPWHPLASCGDGQAPAGGSTEGSSSARLKSSRSPARRANEATRHLLYLFPLPSSRLGTVTRAHSPLVGSQSRGSVTLCRKLAPIPVQTQREGKGGEEKWEENSSKSAGQCTGNGEISVALEIHHARPVSEPFAPAPRLF